MTDKIAAAFGLNAAILKPIPPGSQSRADFECWASDDGESPRAITRNGAGYMLHVTQLYWHAWQACAARDHVPIGSDVLTASDAKKLATMMLDDVLCGDMPHAIDVERLCAYVVTQG